MLFVRSYASPTGLASPVNSERWMSQTVELVTGPALPAARSDAVVPLLEDDMQPAGRDADTCPTMFEANLLNKGPIGTGQSLMLERPDDAPCEQARFSWFSVHIWQRESVTAAALVKRIMHPHSALAVHAFDRFDRVVAQWSRRRELDADRAAIASGSAGALASALLRMRLVTDLNNRVLRCIAEDPDTAFFEPDTTLSEDLVYRIELGEAGDPAAHLDDRAPHPTDTHPPDRQRIETAGVPIDDALMTRAARPVSPADLAVTQGLFRDWAGLSKDISTGLQDEARRRLAGYREHLQTVAGRTNPAVTVLHEALLRPTLLLALVGVVCLVVAGGCVLAALYGGEQDRQAWRLLTGIAVFGAVGFGFMLSWLVRLWSGRREPYLVLSAEGIASPGLAGTLRWLDIQAISVSRFPVRIKLALYRTTPLPPRTRRIRRLQHDVRRHAIQFAGMLPGGMPAAALQAMLLQRAQAAHAQSRLDGPSV